MRSAIKRNGIERNAIKWGGIERNAIKRNAIKWGGIKWNAVNSPLLPTS